MDSFETGPMWAVWASNGLSWLVNAGLYAALLAVALGPVRRRRRDAMGWLLAAAVMGLVVAVVGPAAGWAAALLGSRVGVAAMLLVQAGLGVFGTIFHAIVFLLLLRGVVGLSRPAP